MVEYRKVIELGALERAAERITKEDLEELKALNRQVELVDKSTR